MALQTIPGGGLWIPNPDMIPNAVNSSYLIDATGEKVAMIGRVWNKDHASKNISRVGFRFGTVNKAGGSGLTVSLQDVDLANGPPARPDETQDQTVAIANADAGFVSNAWYRTDALSAVRAVSPGDLLAVVVEYDGSGRLGSDSVVISATALSANQPKMLPMTALKAGAGPSWSTVDMVPNVILEFDDGTFGTLDGALAYSAFGTITYKSDSNPDEYALEFQLPFPCKIDGFWVRAFLSASTSDFNVVLYDGTTAVATVAVDANAIAESAPEVYYGTFASVISLSANHTYRLAVQPSQATSNVRIDVLDVADANHWQAHAFGTSGDIISRVDAGAWGAPTTTRRPMMGVRVCACDDGAGGGASVALRSPIMANTLIFEE